MLTITELLNIAQKYRTRAEQLAFIKGYEVGINDMPHLAKPATMPTAPFKIRKTHKRTRKS